MPKNLTMPRLSDTMEQGTIVKWHVKPGQRVKSGEVVADIETDKATMELQTFDDGVIASLPVSEGQAVPVGTLILTWEGGEGGSVGGGRAMGEAKAQASGPSLGSSGAAAATLASHPAGNGTRDRVFASPLAKKIADESGVDLKSLTGSGPAGRIVRKDVEAVVSGGSTARPETRPGVVVAPVSASAPVLKGQTVALNTMRRTIAARLVESKSSIPHYQVTVAVRMDPLISLRAQLNDQLSVQGVKLSVNDFLVRACAMAMHQHPFVNSRWVGSKGQEAIQIVEQVNIGVAISLPPEKGGGLVVATIRQADAKGLRQISTETRTLADKARTKGLTIEEMADSTFTISNLGMFGVEHFTAIINPPNAAILAVGAAVKKPVIETADGKDQIVIGHEMQMTISSDHRIIDGAMAAQYLATVKAMLEKPASILV